MSLNCNVFLAHYEPLIERLEFMKDQLQKHNIQFSIISDEPEPSWFKDDINARFEKMKKFGASFKDQITWPNASLAWKHLIFLEHAMKSDRPSLILEDDALLSSNFVEVINKILEEKTWDVVFPGSGCNLRGRGHGLVHVQHPATKCTDAYLITPEAAQKVHSTMKLGIDFAIDWELNYQLMIHDLSVCWFEPPVVMQMSQNGQWQSSINGKTEDLYNSKHLW